MRKILDKLVALYRAEPARVNAAVAAAVVLFASKLGVVLDPLSVAEVVAVVAGLIGLGEATRSRVSPA